MLHGNCRESKDFSRYTKIADAPLILRLKAGGGNQRGNQQITIHTEIMGAQSGILKLVMKTRYKMIAGRLDTKFCRYWLPDRRFIS